MWTLNFRLNPLFFFLFLNNKYSYYIPTIESSLIKWRAKFEISRLLIVCSRFAWLNFIYFLRYKLKIKLILRLVKRRWPRWKRKMFFSILLWRIRTAQKLVYRRKKQLEASPASLPTMENSYLCLQFLFLFL